MICEELSSRVVSMCLPSRTLISSGQKTWLGNLQSRAMTSATNPGGPTWLGYFGWLTIRITPFSISGQLAQPRRPRALNQVCADS